METLKYISQILLLLYLGAAAFTDYRTKRVNALLASGAFSAGFILQTIIGEIKWYQLLLGAALGLVLFLASVLSRGGVGKGDSLVISVCGAYLGFFGNLFLFLVALFAAAAVAAGLMIFKKMRGKAEFPFVPCVLGAYVVLLFVF